MNWEKISEKTPPIEEWCIFYDGNNTMNDSEFFVDKMDKNGHCVYNYLHNYSHFSKIGKPDL